MIKTWWEDFKHIPNVDTRWLITWIIIYVSFILLDMFFPDFYGTSLIKYMGIFLCIVYAYNKYYSDSMLIWALALTFLADTILVWTDMLFIGVFIFIFAQFIHLMRQLQANARVVTGYALGILALVAIALFRGIAPLSVAATIYALLLLSNVFVAVGRYRDRKKDFRARCGFYGFIAFACCDACVALRFLMLTGSINAQFLPFVAFMVWVFYYPSQVLIANSSLKQPSHKLAKKSTLE